MRISHFSIWDPSSVPWSFALNSGAGEISELALADIPNSDGKIGHVDGVELFTQKAVCRFPLRATLGYRPVKSATIRHRQKPDLDPVTKQPGLKRRERAVTFGRNASCAPCCSPPAFARLLSAAVRPDPPSRSRPADHRPPRQLLRRRPRREVRHAFDAAGLYRVRHHHRRPDVCALSGSRRRRSAFPLR